MSNLSVSFFILGQSAQKMRWGEVDKQYSQAGKNQPGHLGKAARGYLISILPISFSIVAISGQLSALG